MEKEKEKEEKREEKKRKLSGKIIKQMKQKEIKPI